MSDVNATRTRLRRLGRWRSLGMKLYIGLLVPFLVFAGIVTVLGITHPNGPLSALMHQLSFGLGKRIFMGYLLITISGPLLLSPLGLLVSRRWKDLGPTLQDACLVPDVIFVLQENQKVDSKLKDRLSVQMLDALSRLLPQMTPEEAAQITPQQERFICARLKYRYNSEPQLAQAILAALPLFGSAEALPIVRQVAQDANTASVREAATACLASLEQRLTALKQGRMQNLLQASQAPTQPQGQSLLRASHPTDKEPAEQLLRAHAAETDT